MNGDKNGVRAEAKEALTRADKAYLVKCDELCTERFFLLPEYKEAQVIFCYCSVGSEPDTSEIIRRSLRDGKKVAAPRVCGEGIMEARLIDRLSAVRPGTFGIPEPSKYEKIVEPEEIDIAIVPAVAFSRDGSRLGHGGGYYDRFLPKVKGLTVGLARERLLMDHIPCEDHDIKMACLITEEKTTRPLKGPRATGI